MTETPGLDLLAVQRRTWDVLAGVAAVLAAAAIVGCAFHAHHSRVAGCVALFLIMAFFSGVIFLCGARRVQSCAADGVPVGDWARRGGWPGRTRTESALRTVSPARTAVALLVGIGVVWLLDLAFGLGTSLWELLPLAAFMLMISTVGPAGAAREAVRLVAGLDPARIPAVALAAVPSEQDPLSAGELLRELAVLQYGPEVVAAAVGRCSTYPGSIRRLMDELAFTAHR